MSKSANLKRATLFYHNWMPKRLTDEQVGKIYRALIAFDADGVIPSIDDFGGDEVCMIQFETYQDAVIENRQAYEEKCERLRQNRTGADKKADAEPTQSNDNKSRRNENNCYQISGDTDTVTVIDTDTSLNNYSKEDIINTYKHISEEDFNNLPFA